MVNGCMASLYHISEYHDKCPKTEDSWCLYQKDKIKGTSLYKVKTGLSVELRKAVMPIYLDLCKPEKLAKCLHGKTQNCSESYNGMIWNRVPKSTHVGLNVLSLAVYDAIEHFNYGEKASLDVLSELNVEPGLFTKTCNTYNRRKKRHSVYRMSEQQKKRRKVIRHMNKQRQDKKNKQ